jgi:hypothetical protein
VNKYKVSFELTLEEKHRRFDWLIEWIEQCLEGDEELSRFEVIDVDNEEDAEP